MAVQQPRSAVGIRTPNGFLQIEGGQIAWTTHTPPAPGSRLQAIVCLHDVGSGSREFQPLLERPPVGVQIFSIDWPGHGSSTSLQQAETDTILDRSVSILHATLDSLGIANPILVASGFSAAVAIRYAALQPGNILGIVLCQPAGLVRAESARTKPLSACLPTRHKSTDDERNAILAARRQALRIESLKAAMRPLRDAAEAELQRAQSQIQGWLARLRTPILFALSRESRQYPLRSYIDLLDPLLARSPQHRITVFTGGFHPAWDEPGRFAQAVNGFVQSLLPLDSHHHAWLLAAVDYPTAEMNLWKCAHPECSAEQALPAESNPNAL